MNFLRHNPFFYIGLVVFIVGIPLFVIGAGISIFGAFITDASEMGVSEAWYEMKKFTRDLLDMFSD